MGVVAIVGAVDARENGTTNRGDPPGQERCASRTTAKIEQTGPCHPRTWNLKKTKVSFVAFSELSEWLAVAISGSTVVWGKRTCVSGRLDVCESGFVDAGHGCDGAVEM